MNTTVSAGKVAKLFGNGGELAINLYDTFPEEINFEEPLFVNIDNLAVPLFLEKFERRGRTKAIVLFADFDTERRAEGLIGLELFFYSGAEEEMAGNEIYFKDLIGYTALFAGTDIKGEISGFVDHKHNPLLTVTVGENEVLIPATDELIDSFDPGKRIVTFDLPDGLLELYLP